MFKNLCCFVVQLSNNPSIRPYSPASTLLPRRSQTKAGQHFNISTATKCELSAHSRLMGGQFITKGPSLLNILKMKFVSLLPIQPIFGLNSPFSTLKLVNFVSNSTRFLMIVTFRVAPADEGSPIKPLALNNVIPQARDNRFPGKHHTIAKRKRPNSLSNHLTIAERKCAFFGKTPVSLVKCFSRNCQQKRHLFSRLTKG